MTDDVVLPVEVVERLVDLAGQVEDRTPMEDEAIHVAFHALPQSFDGQLELPS